MTSPEAETDIQVEEDAPQPVATPTPVGEAVDARTAEQEMDAIYESIQFAEEAAADFEEDENPFLSYIEDSWEVGLGSNSSAPLPLEFDDAFEVEEIDPLTYEQRLERAEAREDPDLDVIAALAGAEDLVDSQEDLEEVASPGVFTLLAGLLKKLTGTHKQREVDRRRY